MSDDNIVSFGSIQGGRQEEEFPSNPYVITDIDDNSIFGTGYLIFTNAHVCIMEERGNGPVASVMVPLHRVKVVELNDDEIVDDTIN